MADQQEQKSFKPLNPFIISKHARQNIDKNLLALKKNDSPLEVLRHQSLLAKTYLELIASKNKTARLLANLESDLKYLEVLAKSSPLAQESVTKSKEMIRKYFDAKRDAEIESLRPEPDDELFEEDMENDTAPISE